MDLPNLDQVSSQALIRLAAERGATPAVTPAGEEAVQLRKPSKFKRSLPFVFFALGLFALGSMALGVTALSDDGWSISDGVQLALMALIVFGTITQARAMLRPTPVGRWLGRRKEALQPGASGAAPRVSGYALDAVSAEYLSAIRPAEAATMKRRTVARRAGSRAFDRVSVWVVLVLAVLAFIGMLFILGWILYAVGPADPSVWLTAPFTALTGLGVFQLFRSASHMSFRGRPFALVSRTFRDSVRVWGSGSMATKVAVTTTATASIASAAVIPTFAPQDTLYDIFAIDSASGAVYRIDLQTSSSARSTAREGQQQSTVGLATTATAVTFGDGKTLPKGSLLVVLEAPGERVQVIVAFRPNSNQPIQLARIQPAIPGARFTGGPGVLHALQPDGALWRVQLATGAATRIGTVTGPPGPIAYEEESKSLLMVSGEEIVRLDPSTGAERARTAFGPASEGEVCALTDGPGDSLFFAFEGNPEVHVLKVSAKKVARIVPAGEAAASPCVLAVAYRR